MNLPQSVVDILVAWCAAEKHVCALWLFGSYAKGTARQDSDIDLACVMIGKDNGERLGNWVFLSDRFKAELQQLLPESKISLNHFDPQRSTGIVADAVRGDGILLFERH